MRRTARYEMMGHQRTSDERGVALLMVIIVVAVILGIIIGIATISIRQVSIASDLGPSAVSVAAADAGVEEALYLFWRGGGGDAVCETGTCIVGNLLQSKASYTAYYDFSTADGDGRSIRSIGQTLTGIRRAFELSGF